MSCQVSQCRHPESHITSFHKCGKCQRYGHGRVECPALNAFNAVNALNAVNAVQLRPQIPMDPARYCTVPKCPVPHTHSSGSHQPDFKYATAMGPDQYGINRRHEEGTDQVLKAVANRPGTCATVYWGMGQFLYARNIDGKIDKGVCEADMTCIGDLRHINLDQH